MAKAEISLSLRFSDDPLKLGSKRSRCGSLMLDHDPLYQLQRVRIATAQNRHRSQGPIGIVGAAGQRLKMEARRIRLPTSAAKGNSG